MTKALNLDLFFSNSISFSARVKRMSVAFLHLSSISKFSFSKTVIWSPLGHNDLNRFNIEICSNRLGKAEREIVTAATTPAHRNCSTVLTCSIIKGAFSVLGLIHRIYLVFVPPSVSINLESCDLNFVQTVSATMFEDRLLIFLPTAELWAAFGRFFFLVPVTLGLIPLFIGCIISSLFNSLAMIALLDSLAQFNKSLGKVSVFFLTKLVASYITLPA
mmetsp:Transcript_17437/g.38171  ORF Transcript_17437/g.38171 Transcript_17437/m.38171 type:complete len:218 (+) Transcript_17437:1700-2353(+)